MQFTKAEEYGILGVLYLVAKGGTAVTPLSEIAEAREIPEKFLAKIFQSLARYGIVRSYRGVRGGFTLTGSPAEITVMAVLEAIQGPYHLLQCIPDPDHCDKSDRCAVRDLLVMVEKGLIETFESHTLADLAEWEHAKGVTVT